MLERILIIIHWLVYGLVLLTIFSVIIRLIKNGQLDAATQDIFRYSIGALAAYITILWIIKRKWIYFPWQHDKN